jgi:hypothetical protein
MNEFWLWNGWGAIAAIGQTLGAIATFIAVWATLQTAKMAKKISDENFKSKIKIMIDEFDETKNHDQLKFVVTNTSSFPVQIRMVNLHYNISPSRYEDMKSMIESPISLINIGESKKYSFDIKEIIPITKDTKDVSFFLDIEFSVELISGETFTKYYYFAVRNGQILTYDDAKESSKTIMIDLIKKSNEKLTHTKLNNVFDQEKD